MHENQLELTLPIVARLVSTQFPQWSALPLQPVISTGTVNQLFRLGEKWLLRFPLEAGDVENSLRELQAEFRSAEFLLGKVPLKTPEPVAIAEPGPGFPLPWSIYRWIPGQVVHQNEVTDQLDLAVRLAGFVTALRSLDTAGRSFSGSGRGGSLTSQDEYVAEALARNRGLIDIDRLGALWQRLRKAPRPDGSDRWTHGDLMPGNLLLQDERLSAVIDVATLSPADPALDLMPAWNLLDPASREVYRSELGCSDAEWQRGKAWALAQAVGCLYYYRVSNPAMSQTAERTLLALLDDE
ncbi:aminoglycoside phosphotransferase family protein [Psychromicrobium lacuslunae]|nr:aminoglycoside phosphotransferase family protein [Psychromicrobium lacuslunae]